MGGRDRGKVNAMRIGVGIGVDKGGEGMCPAHKHM